MQDKKILYRSGEPENAGDREPYGGEGQSRSPLKRELFDFAEMLIFALVIVTLVFTFVFRIVGVQGSSMTYTLEDQDRLILSDMFYQPKDGDIVVLSLDDLFTEPIIKRIIATGGQTIDITDSGQVIVDGVVQDEPYIHDVTNPKGIQNFPLTVPEGEVFVMGDNRANSTDSRNFGCVDEKCIMGEAVFRIFPFDAIGAV